MLSIILLKKDVTLKNTTQNNFFNNTYSRQYEHSNKSQLFKTSSYKKNRNNSTFVSVPKYSTFLTIQLQVCILKLHAWDRPKVPIDLHKHICYEWPTQKSHPNLKKILYMTNPLRKAFHIWKKGNANASDEAWMCVLRASDPHYQKETI